ncbi:helix-turn-helix domain-containing protein [Paraburkholderia tropica]|uniref:helix-turn-helix domain-containing protein n=1 Tax=Paraburkholderia tropica TaxID=92647 RepID=UPI002AB617F1|nr:helix-turn-helix domain-containing protein [Paraburkholderia tropica]
MSIQAMAWAIEQQEVRDSHARHVLLCLANYADNHGKTAFPSTSTLVKDTGMSESTIRRKLDALEQAGLIFKGNQKVVAAYIERGDRRPVCYDMAMKKRGVAVTPRAERGVSVTGTGCQPDANGVSAECERGVTVTPNPSLTVNEPSMNHISDAARPTRAKAAKKTQIAEDFEISERVRAWAAENGHANLDRHFAAFVTKCRANGYRYASWDDAFMEAVRADWAGLSRRSAPGASSNRDASRAAAAASIGLGAHAHDDEPTVIDADFRRIS